MEQAVANDAAVALPDAELDAFLRRLLFSNHASHHLLVAINVSSSVTKNFFSITPFQSPNVTLRVLRWEVIRNPNGQLVSEIAGVQSLEGAR